MVVQHYARFRTNLGNLRISQDICYVRITGNNDFLTIYGHRASLLNTKREYLLSKFSRKHLPCFVFSNLFIEMDFTFLPNNIRNPKGL